MSNAGSIYLAMNQDVPDVSRLACVRACMCLGLHVSLRVMDPRRVGEVSLVSLIRSYFLCFTYFLLIYIPRYIHVCLGSRGRKKAALEAEATSTYDSDRMGCQCQSMLSPFPVGEGSYLQ